MLHLGHSCRARFSGADFAFLMTSLGNGKESNDDALRNLLLDEDERDRILDHPRLVKQVLEQPDLLGISSELYFYILVRHLFVRVGLEERSLADYVASLLADFSRANRLSQTRQGVGVAPGQELYLIDWMLRLQESKGGREQFYLQVQIGDLSLFLTGYCHAFLQNRRHRRGAPDLSYYRSLGASSYRLAENHPVARAEDAVSLLGTLAETFDSASMALQEMAERMFSDR